MKYDLWQKEREQAKTTSQGLKVLCSDNSSGKPTLKMWRPKAIKPHVHYYFKDIKSRAEYIRKEIASFEGHQRLVQERKESRKPDLQNISLKKGDIFVTSWGYDQTNYDYIVALEVSATGKTVKCRRTSSLHMGESCQSNVQEPIFCPFGDTFIMQVRTGYREGVSLVGSYPFCHDGTGSKRKDYFSKHTQGQQYHETMIQFGH